MAINMKNILFFYFAYLVSSKVTEIKYISDDKEYIITKDNIDEQIQAIKEDKR